MKGLAVKKEIGMLGIVLIVVCLCACGKTNSALDSDTSNFSTDRVTSGSAMAGNDEDAKTAEQTSTDTFRSANSCFIYEYKRLGNDIQQRTLDNDKAALLAAVKDTEDIIWVNDQWIYYTIYSKDESLELYRMPLIRRGEEEYFDYENKEKLLSWKSEDSANVWKDHFYITDQNIFFLDEGNAQMVRYSLQDMKKTVLLEDEMFHGTMLFLSGENWANCAYEKPIQLNDYVFIGVSRELELLYRLDLQTDEVKKVQQEKVDHSSSFMGYSKFAKVTDTSILYSLDGKKLSIYDCEKETIHCVVSETMMNKMLKRFLTENESPEFFIDQVVCNKGEVYLLVNVSWDKKEKVEDHGKKGNQVHYTRNVILRASQRDLSQWEMDQSFMDFVDSIAVRAVGWDETSEAFINYDNIPNIALGKSNVIINRPKESDPYEDIYAEYDLKTCKGEKISEKKAKDIYWYLYE